MNSASQQKLTEYLDGLTTGGELAGFVMRRIRLEGTFGQREAKAGIWALNFALITAIVNIAILIRQLPFKLIYDCLAAFNLYWAPRLSLNFPVTATFIFALLAAAAAIWKAKKIHTNKIGGQDS